MFVFHPNILVYPITGSKAFFYCGNPMSNNYPGKKGRGQGGKMEFFLELMIFFVQSANGPKTKKIKFDDKGKYCYNEDRFAKAGKSVKSVPIKLAQSQTHPGRLRLRSETPSQPGNAPLQHSRFPFLLHYH